MISFKMALLSLLVTSLAFHFSCSKREREPRVSTTDITDITLNSAIVTGDITDLGDGVTDHGHCWSLLRNPHISDSKISFGPASKTGTYLSELKLLRSGRTYFVKAFVNSSSGISYGNERSFATSYLVGIPVTDIDGNTYKTVIIGSEEWMGENLKTTKYIDGSFIPLVTDNNTWAALTVPGYCWYDNDSANYKATYGALYNWFAVNTNKLCPVGWHVPSDEEWHDLILYLDPYSKVDYNTGIESGIAGRKLCKYGTPDWGYSDDEPINETGFTALMGGGRSSGGFSSIDTFCEFWSSTEVDSYSAYYRIFNDSYLFRLQRGKQDGYSVRCLKDN
jgi:uncharacterized protein (TIGR02145 family)